MTNSVIRRKNFIVVYKWIQKLFWSLRPCGSVTLLWKCAEVGPPGILSNKNILLFRLIFLYFFVRASATQSCFRKLHLPPSAISTFIFLSLEISFAPGLKWENPDKRIFTRQLFPTALIYYKYTPISGILKFMVLALSA